YSSFSVYCCIRNIKKWSIYPSKSHSSYGIAPQKWAQPVIAVPFHFCRLFQARIQTDTRINQSLHRVDRIIEHGLLFRIHVDLDNPLYTAFTDDSRHADVDAVKTILALHIGGAGQDALLVLEIRFGHGDRAGGRRIEGRAGFQQCHNLGAAVAGAIDDRIDFLLRAPAHLDEVRNRDTGNRRIADQRHHGVAVATQNEGRHIFNGDIEFLGEEQAETGTVENTGHADDHVMRQAAFLAQDPDHGVKRVGDADDEGVRRIFLD